MISTLRLPHSTRRRLKVSASACRFAERLSKLTAARSASNQPRSELNSPSSSHSPSSMIPVESSRPTLFVVDDDEPMRESLHALLGVMGYEVLPFSTPGGF